MIKNIDIAGKGVGMRLHKPVLDELGIQSHFVRLPDYDLLRNYNENIKSDYLIIGTPVYKHIKHLEYSISHYQTILCEKPVGNDLMSLYVLYNNHAKARVYVDYQLRFLKCTNTIKQLIASESFDCIHIEYCSNARISDDIPYWYKDINLGGGIAYSILPHIVDLMLYYGMLLNCNLISVCSDSRFLDSMSSDMILESGTLIHICVDTLSPYDSFNIKLFKGSEQTVFDIISDTEVKDDSEIRYFNGALSSRNEGPWRNGFRNLMRSFRDSDQIDPRTANLIDAINVHKVLNAFLSKHKNNN